jgi:hypothetical protein
MAIDSEDKRRSVHGTLGPFAVIAPRPDGGLNEFDRRHAAGLYRGQLIAQALFTLLRPAGVAIQFLLADAVGRVLTEIRPDIQRVSWRRSGAGALAFTLAVTDEKLREEYFYFGNRVLLRFDNGLPAWGGVLTGAAEWTGSAVVFEAQSGEWALMKRRTGRNRAFVETRAGAILTALLEEVDAFAPSHLLPGNIWSGGPAHSPAYQRKSLYDVLSELVGDSTTATFDVTPALEGGYIRFYVNLYERKGSDKPGVGLVEGRNVSGVRYRAIDEIVNVWHLAGEGDGWSDDARVYATAIDRQSTGRHGVREDSETRAGVVQQTAIEEAAEVRLDQTAWPTRVLGLTVTNHQPGLFGGYDVGDAVACRLPSYDFNGVNGMYEVLGREFFPSDGTADLVLLEAQRWP